MKTMTRWFALLLAFALGGCATFKDSPKEAIAPAASASAQGDAFARFLAWFPGEYDNYEQFWLQTVELPQAERPKDPHEHTHHIFAPVEAPLIGAHVFFVKQTMPEKGNKLYRQRLYRVSSEANNSIRMDIFSFKDEKKYGDSERKPELIAKLSAAELIQVPGCEVRWFFNGSDAFDGSVNRKTCRIDSERLGGRVFVEDRWKLDREQILIREAATNEAGVAVYGRAEPHANRRVRFFEGWGAIKKEGKDAPRESKNWYGTRGIVIHSEGQFFPLKKDDGSPAGYSIQLARLTYQNTQQPILKFTLVDDATGRSIAYSWAEIDATRIGINLGWIQAGLTLKKERPEWSW